MVLCIEIIRKFIRVSTVIGCCNRHSQLIRRFFPGISDALSVSILIKTGYPRPSIPEISLDPECADLNTEAPNKKKREPDPDAPVFMIPCIRRGRTLSVKLGARIST